MRKTPLLDPWLIELQTDPNGEGQDDQNGNILPFRMFEIQLKP